jgi:hypothetical protein
MKRQETIKEILSMLSFEKGDTWKVTESRLEALKSIRVDLELLDRIEAEQKAKVSK